MILEELSHVIFLKLRKKELRFTQKDNLGPFWVKILSFCEFAQLYKQFFLFQHEKNHVSQLPTAKN